MGRERHSEQTCSDSPGAPGATPRAPSRTNRAEGHRAAACSHRLGPPSGGGAHRSAAPAQPAPTGSGTALGVRGARASAPPSPPATPRRSLPGSPGRSSDERGPELPARPSPHRPALCAAALLPARRHRTPDTGHRAAPQLGPQGGGAQDRTAGDPRWQPPPRLPPAPGRAAVAGGAEEAGGRGRLHRRAAETRGRGPPGPLPAPGPAQPPARPHPCGRRRPSVLPAGRAGSCRASSRLGPGAGASQLRRRPVLRCLRAHFFSFVDLKSIIKLLPGAGPQGCG